MNEKKKNDIGEAGRSPIPLKPKLALSHHLLNAYTTDISKHV